MKHRATPHVHSVSRLPRHLLVRAATAIGTMLLWLPLAAAEPAERVDMIRECGGDDEWRSFKEGEKLTEAGDHEAARLKFAHAWTVWRLDDILLKLAKSEALSGHFVEAASHYKELLKRLEPNGEHLQVMATYKSWDSKISNAIRVQAALGYEDLLARHVARLEVAAPPYATIRLDGQTIYLSADPLLVTPGKHVVEATVRGRIDRQVVECVGGIRSRVSLHRNNYAP